MDYDTNTSRRGFMVKVSALGAAGAACMGAPGLLGPGSAARGDSDFLATVTCAEFRRHLWTTFRLHPETDVPVDVELVKAEELPVRGSSNGPVPVARTPFSLLFHSRGASGLPQRRYRVEHGQLGSFDLFLVRVNPDRQGRTRYEAIFG